MCRLRNIAMCDYRTDARQSNPYVSLCFTGNTTILIEVIFVNKPSINCAKASLNNICFKFLSQISDDIQYSVSAM